MKEIDLDGQTSRAYNSTAAFQSCIRSFVCGHAISNGSDMCALRQDMEQAGRSRVRPQYCWGAILRLESVEREVYPVHVSRSNASVSQSVVASPVIMHQ
jgi:hypothetical protein